MRFKIYDHTNKGWLDAPHNTLLAAMTWEDGVWTFSEFIQKQYTFVRSTGWHDRDGLEVFDGHIVVHPQEGIICKIEDKGRYLLGWDCGYPLTLTEDWLSKAQVIGHVLTHEAYLDKWWIRWNTL